MDKNFDCDQPLEDPRYEKFCQLRADGISQKDAYGKAGFQASESSIHQAASRLAARPEVKARLRVLQMRAITGKGELTVNEIREKLTMLFRESTSGDCIKALQQLQTEFGILDELKAEREEKTKRPDPCALISYLCTFGGKQGSEIIKELNGPKFVAAQLSEILKVPVTVDGVSAEDE